MYSPGSQRMLCRKWAWLPRSTDAIKTPLHRHAQRFISLHEADNGERQAYLAMCAVTGLESCCPLLQALPDSGDSGHFLLHCLISGGSVTPSFPWSLTRWVKCLKWPACPHTGHLPLSPCPHSLFLSWEKRSLSSAPLPISSASRP